MISMETETLSAPDLSLVKEAFLWAIMKGPSELAIVDEHKNIAAIAEIRNRDDFAILEAMDY